MGWLFLSLSADETQASSAHQSSTDVPVRSSVFRFSAGVFRNSQPFPVKLVCRCLLPNDDEKRLIITHTGRDRRNANQYTLFI